MGDSKKQKLKNKNFKLPSPGQSREKPDGYSFFARQEKNPKLLPSAMYALCLCAKLVHSRLLLLATALSMSSTCQLRNTCTHFKRGGGLGPTSLQIELKHTILPYVTWGTWHYHVLLWEPIFCLILHVQLLENTHCRKSSYLRFELVMDPQPIHIINYFVIAICI